MAGGVDRGDTDRHSRREGDTGGHLQPGARAGGFSHSSGWDSGLAAGKFLQHVLGHESRQSGSGGDGRAVLFSSRAGANFVWDQRRSAEPPAARGSDEGEESDGERRIGGRWSYAADYRAGFDRGIYQGGGPE